MNVDLIQTKSVLIDDSVHTAIARATYTATPVFGTTVTHREKQLHNGFLEEVGVAVLKPLQQVRCNVGPQKFDAALDLLGGIEL
ncbi:hypothetical protein [Arthrobacter pityocampae]|uniref:hypothetical protein n=1 Tax=Arthrobacter pityocampae TaxID=547334 RepID=UPI003734EA7B